MGSECAIGNSHISLVPAAVVIVPRIIRKLSISIPIYFLPQIADSKSIIESSQKYRNINDTVWNNASASVIC